MLGVEHIDALGTGFGQDALDGRIAPDVPIAGGHFSEPWLISDDANVILYFHLILAFSHHP